VAHEGMISRAVANSWMSGLIVVGAFALAACKSPQEKADEAVVQGERALSQGDLDAAENAFQRALDSQPDNPRARAGKAGVLLGRGDVIGALELGTQCTDSACIAITEKARDTGLAELAKASPSAETAQQEIRIHQLLDARCGLVPIIDGLAGLRATDPVSAKFKAEALASAVRELQVKVEDNDGDALLSGYTLAKMAGEVAAEEESCEDAEGVRIEMMRQGIDMRRGAGVVIGPGQEDKQERVFWGAFHKARLENALVETSK